MARLLDALTTSQSPSDPRTQVCAHDYPLGTFADGRGVLSPLLHLKAMRRYGIALPAE